MHKIHQDPLLIKQLLIMLLLIRNKMMIMQFINNKNRIILQIISL